LTLIIPIGLNNAKGQELWYSKGDNYHMQVY